MIRINLLPSQYRRGQKVSTRLVAATLGSALAVCASIGWFGMVYFGELGQLEQAHGEVAADLQEKAARSGYFDKLENNRKDYIGRVQTVQEIGKGRRLWTKFMDELIDVVNNNGDDQRHRAWFDGLTMKGDPKKGPSILMPGEVQGTDKSRLANLHEDIEQSPFAKDLLSKSDPGGKRVTDKTRVPPDSFQFSLQMQFQPPVLDTKPKPKPAQPKPAAEPKKD